MTGKDPKDMTASELLRSGNSNCGLCMMLTDGDCANHGCEEIYSVLADKIDAEIVKAYSEKLNTCAMRWAKANGWPDFREGEDFGAWLDRCALPRPRFEDGEPVQFGDDTDELDGVEKFIFLRSGGWCQMQDADGNICNVLHGKRVKRLAPEVLGADGLPLNEGDTVYGTGREQHRCTVQVPYSINEAVGRRFCVQCYDHDEGNITWCDPSMLTHERPVLGADGKPIMVGDTVYGVNNGHRYTVMGLPVPGNETVYNSNNGRLHLIHDESGLDAIFPASTLTHTPPDTLERLRDDIAEWRADCANPGSGWDAKTAEWADRIDAIIRRTGGAE